MKRDQIKAMKAKASKTPQGSFFESYQTRQAQMNPRNIGRFNHDQLTKVESEISHTKKQLRMSKGQPIRQQYFKDKLDTLKNKKEKYMVKL